MATHSSIPAWIILWTQEPGGLQPMGSQESDVALESKPSPHQFSSVQSLSCVPLFASSTSPLHSRACPLCPPTRHGLSQPLSSEELGLRQGLRRVGSRRRQCWLSSAAEPSPLNPLPEALPEAQDGSHTGLHWGALADSPG